MDTRYYTFIVATDRRGHLRKVRVSAYVVHLVVIAALVGAVTIVAALSSYTRMLWKAASYNALKQEKDTLKQRYVQLQAMVTDTNQKLSSLQSLATEVATTYGVVRFRQTPFGLAEGWSGSRANFDITMEQFRFLAENAATVSLGADRLQLMPWRRWQELSAAPSTWPVLGRITGSFGERLDPFNGGGAFHAGIDISASYGEPVVAAADGWVAAAEDKAGYGRVVVVNHGFGFSSWYAHLSRFAVHAGQPVRRGTIVGYVGSSGRATAAHLHFEVRVNDTPVNPWRYLGGGGASRASARPAEPTSLAGS